MNFDRLVQNILQESLTAAAIEADPDIQEFAKKYFLIIGKYWPRRTGYRQEPLLKQLVELFDQPLCDRLRKKYPVNTDDVSPYLIPLNLYGVQIELFDLLFSLAGYRDDLEGAGGKYTVYGNDTAARKRACAYGPVTDWLEAIEESGLDDDNTLDQIRKVPYWIRKEYATRVSINKDNPGIDVDLA
jgi:hypothetical protein